MSQVTIPNVDDHIVQGLKQIAWRRGVPFDESLRRLLSDAVMESHSHIFAVGISTRMPPETD